MDERIGLELSAVELILHRLCSRTMVNHDRRRFLLLAYRTVVVRGDNRESNSKQRNASRCLIDKYTAGHCERPALSVSVPFSVLPEGRNYGSSHAWQESGHLGGTRKSQSSSFFSSKPSSSKPYHISATNGDDQGKGCHIDLKSVNMTGPGVSTVAKDSPRSALTSELSVGANQLPAEDDWNLGAQEELPSLPDIPLPSAENRGISSPSVAEEETSTKRHRPRLGWGQGLVAPSPPPLAKRPRIGWGQGLVQQNDELQNDTMAFADGDDTSETDASNTQTTAVSLDSERPLIKLESERCEQDSGGGANQIEEVAFTTHEMDTQLKPIAVEKSKSSTPVAKEAENVDNSTARSGDTAKYDIAPKILSKEEVLSTIDVLDSDIAGVKKEIEALQRRIASAEAREKSLCEPADNVIVSAAKSACTAGSANVSSATTEVTSGELLCTPTDTVSDLAPLKSPVKIAVDSKIVELLADVFSENSRKSAAANEAIPKRIKQGQLATKIYHQPSDYPFYKANIDRGKAIASQVRLKVQTRNRTRHEYVKKLAREYVELKKSWKLDVKKMEKDRKRQDKIRMKQLQKQKVKSMSESGPIRTTNTIHQSPHVQQLVAAEKAAEAAGEGTIVRTSSRLTNNSCADLENSDLEKIEQAKAQAVIDQETCCLPQKIGCNVNLHASLMVKVVWLMDLLRIGK
uniref:Uncharacterized protein n=1 Tax=Hyaloperonospora arabidopsidis (strain Emoy2) TaxID=559515 RepID=M4C4Q8_HYAAE